MKDVTGFAEYLAALIRSGHQLIQVATVEERRAMDDLSNVCINHLPVRKSDAPWRFVTWDYVRGFSDGTTLEDRHANNPSAALTAIPTERFNVASSAESFKTGHNGTVTAIRQNDACQFQVVIDDAHEVVLPKGVGPSVRVGDKIKFGQDIGAPLVKDGQGGNMVVVVKDASVFLNSTEGFAVRRALRNLLEEQALSNAHAMRPVILLGAVPVQHPELDASIVNVSYSLPTPEQLALAVDYIAAGLPGAVPVRPEPRKEISDCLRGFSQAEAHDTLGYLAYTFEKLDLPDKEQHNLLLQEIHRRKRDKWASEEVLELVDMAKVECFDNIGGYDLFKAWIARQKLRFTDKAKALGVNPPKGAVLGGVPGTGKSVIVGAIAKELGLQLIKFHVGALFDSLLGGTEQKTRDTFKKLSAYGPCVVLMDEVDKGMAGMAENSGGDSGAASRVLQGFLSWQANDNKEAFVIPTLNRLQGLPPELFRTGRFDRVWWVDLPTNDELMNILDIHLRKRGIDPGFLSKDQRASLKGRLQGAVGSDIETLVEESRSEALFLSNGDSATPTYDILATLSQDLKTISRTASGSLDDMRKMFDGRAYPVSDANAGSVSKTLATRTNQRTVATKKSATDN
jgi:SpoVK/Ycf46/Vps4 family AAA+-type ATPase